jgi:hypothetical protein
MSARLAGPPHPARLNPVRLPEPAPLLPRPARVPDRDRRDPRRQGAKRARLRPSRRRPSRPCHAHGCAYVRGTPRRNAHMRGAHRRNARRRNAHSRNAHRRNARRRGAHRRGMGRHASVVMGYGYGQYGHDCPYPPCTWLPVRARQERHERDVVRPSRTCAVRHAVRQEKDLARDEGDVTRLRSRLRRGSTSHVSREISGNAAAAAPLVRLTHRLRQHISGDRDAAAAAPPSIAIATSRSGRSVKEE